ncbi:MAG TPA: hypothetical protein VN253_01300 [Kofleriaceae bacterium]|nr:hypothetical protein [Kofleriaceae bacterium]
MIERPDEAALQELGESTTNSANAWAGASDYVARGLKVWTRRAVGDDQPTAVRVALAACSLVVRHYPAEGPELHAPRRYIDDMMVAIAGWIADPTRERQERVRSMLDVTRDRHAWQDEHDLDHFWTLEAVDHASLAVWSGERSSYIVPLDYATCAARSVACVYHALVTRGEPKPRAIAMVVDAVLAARK